ELGAEFVHGPSMRRLCESLGLTLVRHPSDGVVFADGALLPLLPLLEVLQGVREQATAHLASGEDDRSVAEFLAAHARRCRALPAAVTGYLLLQLVRNDFAARVSDLSLQGLLAPDVDGYEENYRVREGYDEVPRRLAAGGDVRDNHAASAVVRHRDRVDV